MEQNDNNNNNTDVPGEFKKLISDFVADIKTTFPEYSPILSKWYGVKQDAYIYSYCQNIYQRHHNEILYRMDTLFNQYSESNTEFLPGVSFSFLWQLDDLSEKHRDMIWNYLQMVLISVMNTDEVIGSQVHNTINTLQETFSQQQQEQQQQQQQQDNISDSMPEFMNTKIAGIAKEIAEETANNFSDLSNSKDINGVFESLFKDPEKLMSIVKSVSEKLETKMKSGNLNESELIGEASMMMNTLKNYPGVNEIMDTVKKSKKKSKKTTTTTTASSDEDNFFENVFKELSRNQHI